MEFKLKDMTYGLLMSHTFPGLFLGSEILLAFNLFTKYNLETIVNVLITVKIRNIFVLLMGIFVVATLLGFILDGIHHFLFEDIWKNFNGKGKSFDLEILQFIQTAEQMQIYRHFADDDFWYPYEAYSNIGLAMLPGILLLPVWLLHIGVSIWFIIVLEFIYIATFLILIFEAIWTLKAFEEAEDFLKKGFKNNRRLSGQNPAEEKET